MKKFHKDAYYCVYNTSLDEAEPDEYFSLKCLHKDLRIHGFDRWKSSKTFYLFFWLMK